MLINTVIDEHQIKSRLSKKHIRICAAVIDFALTLAIMEISMRFFAVRSEGSSGLINYSLTGVRSLIPLTLWFLVIPLLESINGQSPGKMIMKIKVVSINLSRASFKQVITRHFFDLVDLIPGFGLVGIISIYKNAFSQRVGDVFANTIVINK